MFSVLRRIWLVRQSRSPSRSQGRNRWHGSCCRPGSRSPRVAGHEPDAGLLRQHPVACCQRDAGAFRARRAHGGSGAHPRTIGLARPDAGPAPDLPACSDLRAAPDVATVPAAPDAPTVARPESSATAGGLPSPRPARRRARSLQVAAPVTVNAMLRDIRAARSSQRDYLDRAKDLRLEAAGHRAFGRVRLSRRCLQAALLLEQAAIAELVDRDPLPEVLP